MLMIPKIIHYCWFGGNPLPELTQKCIASWKKHCPDYEIIEWNESNFDIHCCDYVQEAYEAKKWAFVSDVARLFALVNYGGIYMDTDVEVLKPLDNLLSYEAFSGFEAVDRITTGIMACCKDQPLFTEFYESYKDDHFLREDGTMDTTTNVTRITDACLKYGVQLNNTMQTVNGLTLFPKDYFCPKDFYSGGLSITDNSYTIHHYDVSWLDDEEKEAQKLREKYAKVLPYRLAGIFSRIIVILKFHGFVGVLKEGYHRIRVVLKTNNKSGVN